MIQTLKEKNNNKKSDNKGNGPKYQIDIEGTLFDWDDDTITTEQIIELGGWSPEKGAIEANHKDGTERTLQPGEIIEIKPGIGFSKKVGYKRG